MSNLKISLYPLLSLFLCVAPAVSSGDAQMPTGSAAAKVQLRLSDFHIRDPWILAYAPTHSYYLYASNSDRFTGVHRAGVMVYKSSDLIHWRAPSVVFTVPDGTWADPQQSAWAPEVHAYKGKYYLFVTLHNPAKIIAEPSEAWKTTFARGTIIAVSDSPDGPFSLIKTDSPIAPTNFMTIDGTFYVDPEGKPWMVYAHEWAQKIDGTIETLPLKDDLSAAAGAPTFLFKGSDAPWLDSTMRADARPNTYVTDGPELFRANDGHLLMLWSSFGPRGYIETVARSKSGQIQGPWEQLPPLFDNDGGHGMIFRNFDGQLMLVLHSTNHNPYAKLFEIEDDGDHLKLIRERTDLDGGPSPPTDAAASLPNQGYRGSSLTATTDSAMLQALDMSLPGMEAVQAAVARNDLEAGKSAYLEFRRKSSTPRWYLMPSDMPPAVATDDTTGDEILHHVIRDYMYGNNHRQPVDMGVDFDWTHNPLSLSDPNFTHEWTWCGVSRMQFWRMLANAYWKTHNEKYVQEWVNELDDFAQKEPLNPDSGHGPVSLWRTLDASIRANETWPYAYYHMRDSASFTPDAQWTFTKLMRDHAMMLERGLKVPGRMGNWVASESYGLYTIGMLFPELKEAAEWRKTAIDRIMQEMNTVVPPDGFEAELTPNYDLVSLHGYLGPLQLAELNHAPVPANFKPKLLSMFDALVKVMDQNGEIVATNDSSRVNAIDAVREGLKLGDDPLLEWAVSHGSQGKGLPDSTSLPYAGFFTMRSGWKPGDQFFFFRAGPAGIGHEHEDDLQIVYEAFGKTLLCEGPPSNYDHSDFRRFAIGTAAYSTITVDGMGQHRGANKPPVTEPAPVTWATSPLFDYAAATYDGGYQKSIYNSSIEYHPEDWIGTLDKSIAHTRRILYLRPYYVLVLDSVSGPGHHVIDARFNIDAPSAAIDETTQAAFSRNPDSPQIALYPLERDHLTASILQGERGAPDIVWNVPTVQYEKAQDTPATFATLLYPYEGSAPAIRESSLPVDNHDIWAHSIDTPLESIAIFTAMSNRAAVFKAKSDLDKDSEATALLLLERKPKDAGAGVQYGALQLTEFRNSAMHFNADEPADLLFTLQNGKPILLNAGAKAVTIKLTKPFARSLAIVPGAAIEVTIGGSQNVDGARIFGLPSVLSGK